MTLGIFDLTYQADSELQRHKDGGYGCLKLLDELFKLLLDSSCFFNIFEWNQSTNQVTEVI